MSDIKLFRINASPPVELTSKSVALEKSLQLLIESHLETFLGVRFLASEYSTGKVHGGRIDTLGIDENGCPVIIEYKRSTNENVINQGLFYLDWLMDHKGEFQILASKTLGELEPDAIEWDEPRVICIAGDFTKYDDHAVKQIDRNIELVRYRKYGDEFLLFERVNAVGESKAATARAPEGSLTPEPSPVSHADGLEMLRKSLASDPLSAHRTARQQFAAAPKPLFDVYVALRAYLVALGDDVEETILKRYVAFRRMKNFACVVPLAATAQLVVSVKVDPASVVLEKGFTRDVTNVGHWGTGDLEITLRTMDDFEKAKALLLRSYEAS